MKKKPTTLLQTALLQALLFGSSSSAAQSVGAVPPAPSPIEFHDPLLEEKYISQTRLLDDRIRDFYSKADLAANVVARQRVGQMPVDVECREKLDDLLVAKNNLDKQALNVQTVFKDYRGALSSQEAANIASLTLALRATIHSSDARISRIMDKTFDSCA